MAPERVFKTLLAEVDGNLVVGIVAVVAQLDLKAPADVTRLLDATVAPIASPP